MSLSRRMQIVTAVRALLAAFALLGGVAWVVFPAPDEVLLRDFAAMRGTLEQVSAAARTSSVRGCGDLADPAVKDACGQGGLGAITKEAGALLIASKRRSGVTGEVGFAWLENSPAPELLASRVSPRVETSSPVRGCSPVFRPIDGHWYLFAKRC